MIAYISRRWHAEGGYREFLVIAFPLILSTAAWSVQHFVDRMFLTWYSTEAMAAALPAGMTSFVLASGFMGIASYINTFVAQYVGAGRADRVGPSLWQGVYLAALSGVAALAFIAVAPALFDFIGHEEAVREFEVTYFSILCLGIPPLILSTAFSCFFSGRGKTWTVLNVSVAATVFNIVMDYGLIFGRWGLPEWGIRGAAWATNGAEMFSALLFVLLVLRRRYRREYGTLSGWRLDRELFGRLLRYGGPSGINFMMDMMSFSLFILIVGRLGTLELAATNLAFNVNTLAFMPLIGAGIAVSTMVGQRLGQNRPQAAAYCTWTALHVAQVYMTAMTLAYLFVPQLFLMPYAFGAHGQDFLAAREMALTLLRIVAAYCLFDALYIILTAALKGAGDTRFILYAGLALGWLVMIIPAYVAHTLFDASLYSLWAFLCAYLILGAFVFYWRFRTGKWMSMRVIATEAQSTEPAAAPADAADS